MQIQDLRQIGDGQQIDTELCIIGSGPAGLTIAGEFIGSGIRTLIVESGGLQSDALTSSLDEIESVGAPRVMDQTLVRNRQFGGTSHSWTGRCAPLDDVDLAARDWVPFSGWPVAQGEFRPFLDRAGPYLGLGRNCYDTRLWALAGRTPPVPDVDASLLKNCFWQYSNDSARHLDFMRFGPAFLARAAPDTRILLHATVSELQVNAAANRITGAEVRSLDGRRASIRARAVVLCAGGIENPRILLYSNRVVPAGLGNRHDVVGTFLMDHPRCTLGDFDAATAGDVRDRYGLFRVAERGERHFHVQGVALSAQAQERMQLLNCAAWLTEHRAPDDPWDAAKRLVTGKGGRLARDAWRVASQPAAIARGAGDWLLRGRGVPHKLQNLVLDCIVEQRPDPNSRVMLGERTDRLGLPCARLDWRISAQERATVAQFGRLVRDEFARMGLSALRLADWIAGDRNDEAQFTDASHPIGTTRMGDAPRSSVVDPDCQVHGIAGLYIGGSSVFPTAGHANPTLMIVALALRLADHLKRREFVAPATGASVQAVRPSATAAS